jgi:putative sporulation protein YtxC
LLKCFVDIQDSKYDLINIVCNKDKGHTLTDSQGNDVTKEMLEDFGDCLTIKDNIEYDDILLSALVVAAPKKIKIHNPENMSIETRSTLIGVFKERIS